MEPLPGQFFHFVPCQQNPSFASAEEISLIGHSNGGMVARWVLQNCDFSSKSVAYFISVGGPQRGVNKLPPQGVPSWLRPSLDWFISWGYLLPGMQSLIGPAGYVYNPKEFRRFQEANTFLGKLNNEAVERDFSQRERVLALKGMLLVRFLQDEIVDPKDSEYFSLVAADGSTLLEMEKSGEFWDSDLIGLRALQESGRLFRYDAPRTHDSLTDEDREKVSKRFSSSPADRGYCTAQNENTRHFGRVR